MLGALSWNPETAWQAQAIAPQTKLAHRFALEVKPTSSFSPAFLVEHSKKTGSLDESVFPGDKIGAKVLYDMAEVEAIIRANRMGDA